MASTRCLLIPVPFDFEVCVVINALLPCLCRNCSSEPFHKRTRINGSYDNQFVSAFFLFINSDVIQKEGFQALGDAHKIPFVGKSPPVLIGTIEFAYCISQQEVKRSAILIVDYILPKSCCTFL